MVVVLVKTERRKREPTATRVSCLLHITETIYRHVRIANKFLLLAQMCPALYKLSWNWKFCPLSANGKCSLHILHHLILAPLVRSQQELYMNLYCHTQRGKGHCQTLFPAQSISIFHPVHSNNVWR